METAVFWNVTPCTLLDRYERFGEACCLYPQPQGAQKVDSHSSETSVKTCQTTRFNIKEDSKLNEQFQSEKLGGKDNTADKGVKVHLLRHATISFSTSILPHEVS
jgi:hypothetical protein